MASAVPPGVDLCAIPSIPPPVGVESNFGDPVNLVVPTIAVATVFTLFCVIFFGGRLYSNWHRMKVADYLNVAGFILTTSYTGVVLSLYFVARHGWDVPACVYADDYTWKLLFASNILLGPTQFVVKVSILAVYFDIFAVAKPTKYMIWAGIALCSIVYLPHFVLVSLFNAPRVGRKWSELATNGMPQKLEFYAPLHGIGSIVIDIWIFIIPIIVLSKLRLNKKKKRQVVAIFLVALLAIISSAVSCYWRLIITFHGRDVTWEESQLFIWIIIEQNLAIIVGSMPAFAAFVKLSFAQSNLVSSLRSRLRGHSELDESKTDPTLAAAIETIGHRRGNPRNKQYYYELDDSLLDTRATVATHVFESNPDPHTTEDVEQGIMRTTSVTQEFRIVNCL